MNNKPDSIYTAFGAQPAEAELTNEDLEKFDLFTQSELNRMENAELELIRRTPLALLKELVGAVRERQIEKTLDKNPKVC